MFELKEGMKLILKETHCGNKKLQILKNIVKVLICIYVVILMVFIADIHTKT